MAGARVLGVLGAAAVAPLVLPGFFLQLLTEIAIIGLFATAFNPCSVSGEPCVQTLIPS